MVERYTWMGAKANVTRAFEAKLMSTATLNARPLVRKGKISDTINHEIGPKETYIAESRKIGVVSLSCNTYN